MGDQLKSIDDQGHLNLLTDIKKLLFDAEAAEFHDFANETYSAPKAELSNRLHQIRMNVMEGKYDNKPKPNGDSTGSIRNS